MCMEKTTPKRATPKEAKPLDSPKRLNVGRSKIPLGKGSGKKR